MARGGGHASDVCTFIGAVLPPSLRIGSSCELLRDMTHPVVCLLSSGRWIEAYTQVEKILSHH